jgi:hypothetical protein
MAKIKNDRSKYVKRADLASRKRDGATAPRLPVSAKRAEAFLTAPIDRGFYMDFSPKKKARDCGS